MFRCQSFLAQEPRIFTLILQKVFTLSGVENMRDIDLLDKSQALLIRHEQRILVVDHEFRQPEPATGIVQKKPVKNWLPIQICVRTWLIIDQSTEKSTSGVTVKIGSRWHRAQPF